MLLASLLIYFERTAVLYVLATLGVSALLVVVAVADLGADERPDTNAPATGSGISSTTPNLSRQ